MTAGDQVLENIIKGCKAQASKEIKAELRAGKAAAAKIKRLEARIKTYKELERNFDREVQKIRSLAKADLRNEKNRLNKQRAHVRRAARRVARGMRCIDQLKKKKMTSFIKDTLTNSWGHWATKEDARAMATVRAIAKQGIKEEK